MKFYLPILLIFSNLSLADGYFSKDFEIPSHCVGDALWYSESRKECRCQDPDRLLIFNRGQFRCHPLKINRPYSEENRGTDFSAIFKNHKIEILFPQDLAFSEWFYRLKNLWGAHAPLISASENLTHDGHTLTKFYLGQSSFSLGQILLNQQSLNEVYQPKRSLKEEIMFEPVLDSLEFALGSQMPPIDRHHDFYQLHSPAIEVHSSERRALKKARVYLMRPASFPQENYKIKSLFKAAYEKYRDQILFGRFEPDRIYRPTRLGCLENCQLSQSFQTNGFSAQFTKAYQSGSLRRQWLTVRDPKSEIPLGMIYLNLAGTVSLVEVQFTQSNESMSSCHFLYDRHWNFLNRGSACRFLDQELPSQAELRERSEESQDWFTDHTIPKLLLCESLYPYHNSGWWDQILIGPHSSRAHPMGWIKPSQWRPSDRWNGLLDILYAMGIPASASDHSRLVIEHLNHQAPGTKIAALDTKTCIERIEGWRDQMKSIRVASISASIAYDRVQCERHVGHALRATSDEMLWVFSAGNESRRGPNPLDCPQNLDRFDNRLVVSHQKLGQYGNSGTDYVDLVANGFDLDSGLYATSLSAPRVAGVAAHLAAKFPRLTPVQLKIAILLGVEFDDDRYSETRSGGILSEHGAEKIANLISASSDNMSSIKFLPISENKAISIIQQAHCPEKNWRCIDQQKRRIKHLKKTQVIKP